MTKRVVTTRRNPSSGKKSASPAVLAVSDGHHLHGKPDGIRTACLITETAKKFDIPVSVLFVATVRHDKLLRVSEAEAVNAAMIFLSNGNGGGSHVLTKSVRALAERIKGEKNPQKFLRGLGVDVPRRSTPFLGGRGRGGIISPVSLSE